MAAHRADATRTTGHVGRAYALVMPGRAEEVADVVARCCERDVAIVARGGGTGFAGGATPVASGVVVASGG